MRMQYGNRGQDRGKSWEKLPARRSQGGRAAGIYPYRRMIENVLRRPGVIRVSTSAAATNLPLTTNSICWCFAGKTEMTASLPIYSGATRARALFAAAFLI